MSVNDEIRLVCVICKESFSRALLEGNANIVFPQGKTVKIIYSQTLTKTTLKMI